MNANHNARLTRRVGQLKIHVAARVCSVSAPSRTLEKNLQLRLRQAQCFGWRYKGRQRAIELKLWANGADIRRRHFPQSIFVPPLTLGPFRIWFAFLFLLLPLFLASTQPLGQPALPPALLAFLSVDSRLVAETSLPPRLCLQRVFCSSLQQF